MILVAEVEDANFSHQMRVVKLQPQGGKGGIFTLLTLTGLELQKHMMVYCKQSRLFGRLIRLFIDNFFFFAENNSILEWIVILYSKFVNLTRNIRISIIKRLWAQLIQSALREI